MEPTKQELALISNDPLCAVIGVGPLLQHIRAGDLDGLLGLDNWYPRYALIDQEFRALLFTRAIAHVLSADRDTCVKGLHDLRILTNATAPAWLSCLPDALRWIMLRDYAHTIDGWQRRMILRVAAMTPDEFRVYQYFLKRSMFCNPVPTLRTMVEGHELKRLWWNAWNWTSSSWEETTKKPEYSGSIFGWAESAISAVTDYAEQVYEGADYLGEILGDEYGDEVIAASSFVVKSGADAAEAIGIIEPPKTWQKRIMPDPKNPDGYRVVLDFCEVSPLARFGEGVITGVGDVDDSLRNLGLGKSARLATMAVGTGIAVTGVIAVVAKVMTKISNAIKGVFIKAPVGVVTDAGLSPSLEVWKTLQANPIEDPRLVPKILAWLQEMAGTAPGNITGISQTNIGQITIGAAQAGAATTKLGVITKLGVAGAVTAGLAYTGNVVFAYFLGGEVGQGQSHATNTFAVRKDPEGAITLADNTVKRLEDIKKNAYWPGYGGIVAGWHYVDSAIQMAKTRRKWCEEDLAKAAARSPQQRTTDETALPVEAREVKKVKHTEQEIAEKTAYWKAEMSKIFLELRRIRIHLGHKRLKLGEDVALETTNLPMLKTFVSRDRMMINKEYGALDEQGKRDFRAKLQDAGYDISVISETDLETELRTTTFVMGKYKKLGLKK